jgi:hypothetical protein
MTLRVYRMSDTYGFKMFMPLEGVEEMVLSVPDGTSVERVPGLGPHAFVPSEPNVRHMLTAAQLFGLAEDRWRGCKVVSRGIMSERRTG